MKLLALIPARGGSKRIPRKNIVDLGGKPLIAWTIEAACKGCVFSAIALSTDSVVVADAAMHIASIKVIRRPDALAADDYPTLPVVLHALEWCGSYDAVVVLQPTSPFRTATDIREAVDAFEKHVADSLVGVDPCGRVNGAIYITRTKALARGAPLYDNKSIRFYMSQESSFDIDTPEDLEHARGLVAARGPRVQ